MSRLDDVPTTSNTPFVILKLVGMNPKQVASIHEALDHPEYHKELPFLTCYFKPRIKFGEPVMACIDPPIVLSSRWDEKYKCYVLEIKVPILLNNGDPLFADPVHRCLMPLSVIASIFSAAGIFPSVVAKEPIGLHKTHGEMKIIDPFHTDNVNVCVHEI